MGFRDDERGQAIQIGFILIFGVLVISFASYQAFVVPNQNSEVEFNHNQQVQGQLQELRNAIVSSVGRTTTAAVTVDLGTTYPSRIVAANPPSPSGTLRTVGTTDDGVNLSVNNAVAQNRETADYWNGTRRNFSTGLLEYRPNYNEYNNAPRTVYDNTLLYNQFQSANRTVTGQSLVDGNELTLVVLNGSLQVTQSTSTTVDVRPVSTPDGATIVEPEPGETLTVSFVSRLPAKQWNETLAGERNASPGDDRYVTDVSPGPARTDGLYNVELTFEDATYRLRMAKVGVGNGVTEESTAYLTDIDGEGTSVQRGDNATVTLSTRDQFGNPVTAATVYANSSTGSFADDQKETDANGRVSFIYDSDGVSPGTQQLNFSLSSIGGSFDQSTGEDVTVNVTVTRGGGGGGGSAYDVEWLTDSGNDFTLDLAGDTTKDLVAGSSITAEGLSFDYAVSNTSVATVDPGDGVTNSSGENRTTVTANNTGTAAVYVVSGGSSDVVNVTVEDTEPPTVDSFAPVDGSTTNTEPNTITFDVTDSGSGVDLSTLEVTLSDSSGDRLTNAGVTDPNIQENSGTVTIDLTSNNGQDISLADGDVTTDVTVSDNAGNSGAGSATFTLDTTPPSPSIDQVTTSGGQGSSDVTVDWSVTDNIELSGGTVNEIRLVGDGTTVEPITPTGTVDSGSVTFTGVNTNKVTEVVIEVTDGAGNSATDSEPVN
jgi:hypothetical protein